MSKVGFIGLGNMGRGTCENLLKHGNEMAVYDVYTPAMERFAGRAYLAESPADVIKHSDYVFMSLPNSEIVESTVHQMLEADVTGKVIIDTSTSFPVSTRKLYEEVKAAGGSYVDAAPLAGPDEAAAGELDIYVGGDEDVCEKLVPLFDCYTHKHDYVGPTGTGHLLKIAINFISLTEALMFAQLFPVIDKMGYPTDKLFEVFEGSVLKNWTSNFYTKKYKDRQYHLDFALALGTKDLSYMKKIYDELGVPAYVLDGALQFCEDSLKEQKAGEPPIDMSYPCETMYHKLGM